ncbi:uncharacterized protein Z519_10588 [Cladophialophora bantiana CBS 173.52]|uniref:Uncharacterized protein n=1 Tax=Cladophialophora bantiana (strain ATCC 10958 / CBS 173.52 / CDC B-1940 / NIH 8579) TaxID=1442370 RepID=A0A0D2FPL9_CLAB1|nr:uncharacterized protein Z519_10588 [Cladophialophora bantiana CBS 173.52]KIW88542.1 hypothetical protein Z519_10588 [Cladophialophora bantiana CBS 173.52]
MSATYIFTTSPWSKEAISLGSIVPDRRCPNEDIIKGAVTEEDVSVTVNNNFKGVIDNGSQTILRGTIAALWLTICSIFWKVESTGSFEISAKEARLYSLSQPTAIFQKLCELDHVRKFFQDCHRQEITPAFVTGYRTLTDAKLLQKGQSVSTASGSGDVKTGGIGNDPSDAVRSTVQVGREMNDGRCLEYQTKGEAVFAINFRKILIKVRKSELVPSLERQTPTSWLIFSNVRGKQVGEAEVIQVSLDTSGVVKESVLVFEDADGSFLSLSKRDLLRDDDDDDEDDNDEE